MSVASRLQRLESVRAIGDGRRVEVVSIYPGETQREAWGWERPGLPLPQSGLTVFLTRFSGKRPNAPELAS